MRPLPGLLDHLEFERVSAELGRCRICGQGMTLEHNGDLYSCNHFIETEILSG